MDMLQALQAFGLERTAHLFSIVGVLVGAVSLLLVVFELRQQTKATKASNAQALVELTNDMNLELAKDMALASLWEKGLTDFESLGSEEQGQYRRIWIIYLNVQENAFHQHRLGIIEEGFYASWAEDLVRNRQPLAAVWPSLKDLVSESFRAHIDSILMGKALKKATPGDRRK